MSVILFVTVCLEPVNWSSNLTIRAHSDQTYQQTPSWTPTEDIPAVLWSIMSTCSSCCAPSFFYNSFRASCFSSCVVFQLSLYFLFADDCVEYRHLLGRPCVGVARRHFNKHQRNSLKLLSLLVKLRWLKKNVFVELPLSGQYRTTAFYSNKTQTELFAGNRVYIHTFTSCLHLN